MSRLKTKLNGGKNRWICSAFCTSFLVCVILFLPVWNFKMQGSFSESKSKLENSISVVTVTKKKKIAPIQKTVPTRRIEKTIEKKLIRPKQNVIPPQKKVEEKVEEEIAEKSEEAEETTLTSSDTKNQESSSTESSAASAENILQEPVLSDSEKKELESYKSYALARIASKKKYPYSARSQGLEGKVRVRIVINPDGSVAETEILEKCEHEVLNEACLDAIKKAAPFKKMKKSQNAITLTFVMDFSLKIKS